ncbi:M48 family metallopeptidase [Oscillatoria sp. CS-180]|uniref:M48 family metallopeptidase n=1 Tax=Oscillatoria sp. CS-180 TaxID=3021720 RepID=UPI00232EF30A|nr:M48 family metallopeptidase [Oscillatoria sp. CS-180]MDB9524979.1 M48 family metallopeptidase [Oscillatoria sp. CS-180]
MGSLITRLGLSLIFAIFGLFTYFNSTSENPITGETQRVQLTPQQEVVLGQQGKQEVIQQYGGLYPDEALQAYIDQIGQRVVEESIAGTTPYPFEFHVVGDSETVNAFALPGGQIFITTAMLAELEDESQLAGILGHEAAHVVARHGSERLARQNLGALLVQAIAIAASDGENNSGRQAAIIAQSVNQLLNLRYSREDELESDRLGLEFMVDADYDPRGIVELMEILNSIEQNGRPPEFLSTHPNPENRVQKLEALIAERFPNGIPPELTEGEGEIDPRTDLR